MADHDFYAAPQLMPSAPTGHVPDLGVWRADPLMIMRKIATLPNPCIKCNEAANGYKLKRNLRWHSPGYFLLIFVDLLVYVIVALIVRQQKAMIHVGLCETHRRRRRNTMIIAWLVVLAGIATPFVAVALSPNNVGPFILVGLVVFMFGAIGGALGARVVWPTKIDPYYVWLKGVDPGYLQRFPPAP
jgi:hypothetical protein